LYEREELKVQKEKKKRDKKKNEKFKKDGSGERFEIGGARQLPEPER